MLLSAVFVLVVAQSCWDIPEGLMNNSVFQRERLVNEREHLKRSVLKVGKWPVSKSEMTKRKLKHLDILTQ
jgi:hypothetical protein